jgi:hypothetical protein
MHLNQLTSLFVILTCTFATIIDSPPNSFTMMGEFVNYNLNLAGYTQVQYIQQLKRGRVLVRKSQHDFQCVPKHCESDGSPNSKHNQCKSIQHDIHRFPQSTLLQFSRCMLRASSTHFAPIFECIRPNFDQRKPALHQCKSELTAHLLQRLVCCKWTFAPNSLPLSCLCR